MSSGLAAAVHGTYPTLDLVRLPGATLQERADRASSWLRELNLMWAVS